MGCLLLSLVNSTTSFYGRNKGTRRTGTRLHCTTVSFYNRWCTSSLSSPYLLVLFQRRASRRNECYYFVLWLEEKRNENKEIKRERESSKKKNVTIRHISSLNSIKSYQEIVLLVFFLSTYISDIYW